MNNIKIFLEYILETSDSNYMVYPHNEIGITYQNNIFYSKILGSYWLSYQEWNNYLHVKVEVVIMLKKMFRFKRNDILDIIVDIYEKKHNKVNINTYRYATKYN